MRRLVALDGLRAVAILAVMFFHASNMGLVGGWIGVDIFFVLSGFLITSLLTSEFEHTGSISFRLFYLRRILRLVPALALLLICYAIVIIPFSNWPGQHERAILAAAGYVMNWVRAFELPYEGLIGHTWSLSIEEQFYLIWPLVLLSSLRFGGRRLACVSALSIAVLIITWRSYLIFSGASFMRSYDGFDTRADELFVGSALALVAIEKWKVRLAGAWCVPALTLCVFLIIAPWNKEWVHIVGFPVITTCAAWLILTLTSERYTAIKALLSTKPMVFIGKLSYGIYLWHAFISQYMGTVLHIPQIFIIMIIAPISIPIACFSYYFVERPFLTIKEKTRSSIPIRRRVNTLA